MHHSYSIFRWKKMRYKWYHDMAKEIVISYTKMIHKMENRWIWLKHFCNFHSTYVLRKKWKKNVGFELKWNFFDLRFKASFRVTTYIMKLTFRKFCGFFFYSKKLWCWDIWPFEIDIQISSAWQLIISHFKLKSFALAWLSIKNTQNCSNLISIFKRTQHLVIKFLFRSFRINHKTDNKKEKKNCMVFIYLILSKYLINFRLKWVSNILLAYNDPFIQLIFFSLSLFLK